MDNDIRSEWLRGASSGREDIRSFKWVGDGKPRALVQIAHGMAEHPLRYDSFARFLVGQGFAVFMNEHAGHGPYAETLGYFAEKNGMDYLVADMKSLDEHMRSEYPDLPVFLIGHSMGSFLSRKYIALYGNGLTGCILSGTAGPNPLLVFGRLLSAVQKRISGPKSQGNLITGIAFGSYISKIKNPVNRCAWLSTDDDVCIEFANDKYCGFTFTAAGYNDLFRLLAEIGGSKWVRRLPKSLPLFILSGDKDPVGAYGKGVRQVYESLKNSGQSDISLKLYPGGRHEMLNEVNKEEVYADILTWLNSHL